MDRELGVAVTVVGAAEKRTHLREGAWGSIFLIYGYGLLAVASLSKMPPIAADMAQAFGASSQQIGVVIGLLFIAPALAATGGGWFVDRLGARRMLVAACLVIAVANGVCYFATRLLWIEAARLLEGIGYLAISAACPTLIITTTTGERQMRGMVLWSTYFAVGTTVGMLLAAPFAGAEYWRATFLTHGFAAVVLGIATRQLPANEQRVGPSGHELSSLAAVLREIGVVRLGIAFAAVTVAGLGVNVVLPQYLANLHHVSVSAAATILAVLSVPSILGGALVGVMLTRGFAPWLVAALLCLGAMLSALLLFMPHTGMALSIGALLAWQLTTTGGLVALIMALIPRRLSNPAVTGIANGLIVQLSCMAAAVAPPIFLAALASGVWWNFLLVISACIALAFLAMPLADRSNRSIRGAVQEHN